MKWQVDIEGRVGGLQLEVELRGDERPVALIGANGAGKTSLLRLLAGAHRPRRGTIEVAGELLFCSERGIDVPGERRRIGYLPQGYGLFPHLRVIDNVAFGLAVGARRLSRTERRAAALALLRQLDCAHLAQRMPRRLSGGEAQRVALARALAIEPEFLLLDEPMAALDAGVRRSVREFLANRLRSLGRPAIVVTHDVRDVLALDAEVCVLDRGRVVQRGELASLAAAPASEFVAEFVAAAPAMPSG